MSERATLGDYLAAYAGADSLRGDVAAAVDAVARACIGIAVALRAGALAGPLGALTGKRGETDPQRALDVMANEEILAAIRSAPVALLVSEELDEPQPIHERASVIVAVDPLDGASNADTNAAIGTIFSVLPNGTSPSQLSIGSAQLAAGFVVYGPQTVLALTLGGGTHLFTLDHRTAVFVSTACNVKIPETACEFAINAANHWHWDEPIRTYVDDCLRGIEGPRATTYNMRWTGSFVAEAYRILVRGGVYLYPGDNRRGYRNGRLRAVYEANPVAWVIEQAGGAASTGSGRLLDCPVLSWHQRTPVVIGSRQEVAFVERLHADPHAITDRSPLFGRRGLFRV